MSGEYREIIRDDLTSGNVLEVETPAGWYPFPYRRPKKGWELDWDRIENDFDSYREYFRIKV